MAPAPAPPVTVDEFERLDIRVGTIVDVKDFPNARRPAYRLWIDFGPELGTLKSSAQITANYSAGDLVGRQVMAVVNFPPRQIADFMSQALVLGVPDVSGEVVLVSPSETVPDGGRLY